MKKNVLFLLFFLSMALMAQDKPFQVSVGLNQSWFRFEKGYLCETAQNFRPEISAAVSFEFARFGNLASNAGIRFYSLGRSVTTAFLRTSSEGDEAGKLDLTFKWDHYLISLPLQLKYKTKISNLSIIFNAETSYIVNSSFTDYPPSELLPPSSTLEDITGEVNRIQFALGLGVEYKFVMFDQNFGVTSIYNYGLTKVPKAEGGYPYKISELNLAISYYF